jgi:hypothetical protein
MWAPSPTSVSPSSTETQYLDWGQTPIEIRDTHTVADESEIVILPVLETGTMIDSSGDQLPTVVVDATGHPEIADLARVHAVEGIGDIATEAAAVPAGDGAWRFFLAVIISSPVTCAFVLEFALPSDRRVLDEAAAAGRLVIATTPPERAEFDQPLWLAIDLDRRSLVEALPD